MSGIGSTTMLAMGGGAYRAPFTAIQWQELEQQAMIYKYLVAGLPIPPDLVMTIRHSLEALSARFFQYQYPSLGYSSSYYGKKFDPEPGRCRRTDGKKWRCSKEAHPDSKYCERHMHRGRNRSRKPVDSQSTVISNISSNSSDNGSLQNVSFQHMPLYSVGNTSEGSSFGSNVTKLQKEPTSYWMDNKEFSYIHGTTHSSSSFKQKPENEIGSSKQEQNPVHPFFSEWPTNKESWSNLDDDNVNVLSSTQLSIAIPRGSSDFPSISTYSSNDA